MSSLHELYLRLGVPKPSRSPEERYQRRLAWRNERVFHRRKCDYSGRPILSIFSEDKPFPVYAQEIWWSDCWDARSFGREYDFTRPFFPQFRELFNLVPQRALNAYASENSEYTNQCMWLKNCYLLVASCNCEDCYFSMWAESCKDCMDCLYLEKSELCYEVVVGKNCYDCTSSEVLENCASCHFCLACIGCKNCFGCANLRNKEFYFLNEPLTREAYLAKLAQLELQTRQGRASAQALAKSFFKSVPRKYYVGSSIENASGDFIQQAKDSHDIFNCRHVENVSHCQDAWRAHHCADLTETIDNSFCIELEGSGLSVECCFSMKTNESHNAWYCSHCSSTQNMFGCVGMRNAKYCILNREYSPEEFQALRARIVEQMKASGEWGEHFPIELSPFGYNETVAFEYFPLSRAEVLARGWKWHEEALAPSRTAATPPESPDSEHLLDEIYSCSATEKPFRIITAEQAYYLRMHLPVPEICPDERHKRRMAQRNPRRLGSRVCADCGVTLETSYPPSSEAKVLCEPCYLNAVE